MGEWDLPFGEIMSEAWELTKGSKLVILCTMLVYVLGFAAFTAAAFGVAASQGIDPDQSVAVNLVSYVVGPLLAPLIVGAQLYAARRASGQEVGFGDVAGCLAYFGPLVGLALLTQILTIVGFFLLVLPGIYLSVAYLYAPMLLVDRGLGIWESLETSRKAVTTHWFQVFGLGIVMGLVGMVALIVTLGIGSIWALPWMWLVSGVTYRRIFGPTSPA